MSKSTVLTMLRIIGFVLSIPLTIAAITLMRREEQGLLPGVILLLGSLVLFSFSARSLEKHPLTEEETAILKPYLVPGALFFTVLATTVLVIFNVTDIGRTTELNHAATAEWIIGLLALIAGVLWIARWKPTSAKTILEWIRANRLEFGLAAAIVIAGFIVRVVALNEHPYPWSGDEASIGIEARRLLTGDNTNWFDVGWSGQPNVSFLPTALSLIIFGQGMFAVKMVSVLTGTLSILFLYLLAREWFGRDIALMASAFLVAFPFHLQFSRIGVNNIVDSMMAPLVIWLIFRAVRTRSLPVYLAAGIVTGFTFYTYVGTRLVLAMGIGTLVYIAIRQRDYLRTNLPQLGTYLAGLVITIAPMAAFFIKNPQLFMTRIGQEGIFLNGWLALQVEQTGQSAAKILFDQFSQTVLVFFTQNAGSNFLNFDRPYLTVLGAVFFMIGLAMAFLNFFEKRYFILQMWFWSVLTLGGFLTLSPPANTRLVMTTPVTGLFIALGAWQISRALLQLKFKQSWIYALNIVLILALAYQNLTYYFGPYRTGRLFQDANGELGMETGRRLHELGKDYDYYLFGLPRVFAAFPTTDFLNPGVRMIDLNEENLAELSLDPQKGAFIVAIPENQDLLEQVKAMYPGGSSDSVKRYMDEEILYYAYILEPGTVKPAAP
jgi:4-amino-4-deoxy-L-arabinose transferase-like glycosyltransferase